MSAPDASRASSGWPALFGRSKIATSLALSGGAALHAVNLYIAITVLPSVVREIGGLDLYAWNTTVFVLASLIGAAASSAVLAHAGARAGYALAAVVFIAGAMACAGASDMVVMLVGRFLQGIGGGVLLALAYAMVRRVYAEPLWPRALALLSAMWGLATLVGPAVGGHFAEHGLWRASFLAVVPVAVVVGLTAMAVLPGRERERPGAETPPAAQLAILALAVLAASWGGIGRSTGWTAAGMATALILAGAFVRLERTASQKLLPADAYDGSKALGGLYALSGLLAATVTSAEIFLPLFLQELHGLSPVEAGYIAAVMSAGWTAAAIFSSGLSADRRSVAVRAGPVLSLTAMVVLVVVMPWRGGEDGWTPLVLICGALALGGAGVGLAYPLLSTLVLRAASAAEADKAAASIMTVQLCATAFGAAFAGLSVNLAGTMTHEAGASMANSARWLFITLAAAPMLCCFLMTGASFRQVVRRSGWEVGRSLMRRRKKS